MPFDHKGASNGAEDIDEFFYSANGVGVYIEKMDDNEYFIGIDGPNGESVTMFIGHWPGHPGKVNKRKAGNLLLNIVEANCGSWHY